MYQINMFYFLNFHNVICQIYFNKEPKPNTQIKIVKWLFFGNLFPTTDYF